ncbi:MAG: ThiF family adenylyltransferase, partial [Proteobacteria bacterium]|nr:ThiF family adenylyltransferase [Pseudomonadota bacterium]
MNEERFGSLARVYGAEELEKIQNANICIVGMGGVGSWVAEALARTGVQHLTLIDGDDISRSNINRQCHALESTIGQMKAKVMQQRILDINPECECKVIEQYINDENVSDLLMPDPATSDSKLKFDCIIDAIDRIKYKSLMIHFCKKNKIKVIATGGAGG